MTAVSSNRGSIRIPLRSSKKMTYQTAVAAAIRAVELKGAASISSSNSKKVCNRIRVTIRGIQGLQAAIRVR
jgi:hypothetical protein